MFTVDFVISLKTVTEGLVRRPISQVARHQTGDGRRGLERFRSGSLAVLDAPDDFVTDHQHPGGGCQLTDYSCASGCYTGCR